MALSFNPIRTPWMSALLLLMLIWSVWFLDAPASVHRQNVSHLATDTTKAKVHSADQNPPPVLSSNPKESFAPIVPPKPAETRVPIPPSKPKEPSIDEAPKQVDSAKITVEQDPPEVEEEEEEDEDDKAGQTSIVKPPIDGAPPSKNGDTPPIAVVPLPHPSDSERPLILYAYSETPNARANLKFFLAHGLHQSADFVFIINGKSDAPQLIPSKPNIRIVQRPNDCYDLGAHAEVLTRDDLYKRYRRFILMNASIRGPFVPAWAGGCWSDMYLGKITDEVKLVGMTANCWPSFHVQSMIWATDSIGISLLLYPPPNPSATGDAAPEIGINGCFHTWDSAVHAEISATQIIRDAGYQADVMMAAFHSDAEFIENCDTKGNGDVLWNGKYYGTNVHPYETVFLKTNRDIDPVLMERLTSWTDGSGYTSYEHC